MNDIKEEGIKIEFDEPASSSLVEYSSLNHATMDTSEAVCRRCLDAGVKRNHAETPTRPVRGDVKARFCEAALGCMGTSDPSKLTPSDADDCLQTPCVDALPVWSSLKQEAPPENVNYKEHYLTLPPKVEAPHSEDICSTLSHESDILGPPSNFNSFVHGMKCDICHNQPNLLGLPAALDLFEKCSIDPDGSNDQSSPLDIPADLTLVHPKVSYSIGSPPHDHFSGLHLLLPDANQNMPSPQTHLLGLPSRLSSSKAKIYPSALDYESGLFYAQFCPSSFDSPNPSKHSTTICGFSDQSDPFTPQSINPQVLFSVVCFSCGQPVQNFLKKHLANSSSCRRAYIQANKPISSDSKPTLPSIGKIKVKQEQESNPENSPAVYRESASGGNAAVPQKSIQKHAERGSLMTHQKNITVAANIFNLDEITRVKCLICKDLFKSLDDHLLDNKRCLIRYQVKYGKKKFPFSCREKPATPLDHMGHVEQETHVKQGGNIGIKKESNVEKDEINVRVKEERNIGVKEEENSKVPAFTRKDVQCNSKRKRESETKSCNGSSQPINSTWLNVPFQRKSFQFWGREGVVGSPTLLPAHPLSGASCGDDKHQWDSWPGSINKKASLDTNPGPSSRASNLSQLSCASSCSKLLRRHNSAARRVESSFKVRALSAPSAESAPMSSSLFRRHRDFSHKEQLKTLRMEQLRQLTQKKTPAASCLS